MRDTIYTIPVTEAFSIDCECPLCQLHKKLDDECVDYILGPSLMEPDSRQVTNEKGFCRRHFELLYNSQKNRLGLGLILDSFLNEKNLNHKKVYEQHASGIEKESCQSVLKNLSNKITSKQTETTKYIDDMLSSLKSMEKSCSICSKLDYTMDRYIDVTIYLWGKEQDFRNQFNKKGFCLKHFEMLLTGSKKYLSGSDCASFVKNLAELMISNMERINEDVSWFTKKFDYRYNDAPWKNSQDAVPRSIQKIVGYSDLK
ncbi:MAG TPA: DUF6062 family protein [Clostridia bacterium]